MKERERLRVAARPGAYARTAETIEQILNATLDVLIEEGYAALTMRRVAAKCGTRAGNISYHFPTKEALLHGLLDAVLEQYVERSTRLRQQMQLDDREGVAGAIVYLLQDIQTFQTTHLFPELWSMANHDPAIEARLQEFYDKLRQSHIQTMLRINPSLSYTDAETLCLFISSFIEGSTVFIGNGKKYADRMPDIAALAIRSFSTLIETVTPAEIAAIRQQWFGPA
jgi:AcrR family transcriptional regulator